MPRIGTGLLLAALLTTGVFADEGKPAPSKEKKKKPESAYDFVVKTIDGKDFDLRKLEGRVALFVNVASQ